MSSKKLVFLSVLVAMGAVLHGVLPGIFFGMKPDMMLVMMFLGIFLFPDLRTVSVLGIVTGIISAMTTNFPSGQIPNIVDKIVTALIVYLIYIGLRKIVSVKVLPVLLTVVGTLISGTVFLSIALLIAELPASFTSLFVAVVLPAILVNSIVMFIVYPLLGRIQKQMNLAEIK